MSVVVEYYHHLHRFPELSGEEKETSAYVANALKDMGYENGKCGIFDFEKMGLKRYYTQPVEVDARVFAESVVGRVYA